MTKNIIGRLFIFNLNAIDGLNNTVLVCDNDDIFFSVVCLILDIIILLSIAGCLLDLTLGIYQINVAFYIVEAVVIVSFQSLAVEVQVVILLIMVS